MKNSLLPISKIKTLLHPTFHKFSVDLAYIFGSIAQHTARPESDVDIAVLLSDALSQEERFELRLKLIGAFSHILKKSVDVVILNDTVSLFFKYVIIKEGRLLYQKSEEHRMDFESRLMSLYFDYQPFFEQYQQHYVETHL